MFAFDQKPLGALLDLFRSSAPDPSAAAGTDAAPAPALPAPGAASPVSASGQAARSEIGSPFIDGAMALGSSVASGAESLFKPVDDLAHQAGSWLGGLFGSGAGGGGNPAPSAPATAPLGPAAAGSSMPSGWAMAGHDGDTPDVTPQYQDLVARAHAGENTLPEDASQYAYLMVPGFLGKDLPGYLDPNLERMKALGLDASMANVDTGGGVDTNAAELKEEVDKIYADQHRQVVLSGQSEGGVDITAAMAKYPELADKVRAVVAMQAPYGGTPLADGVEGNPVTKALADSALTGIFGGDPASISDLTYASRQKFVGENPYPSDQVPTVSLATSTTSQTSPLTLPGNYMRNQLGLQNDGMVPTADEVIPGSEVVRLDGMDHAGSNLNLPFNGQTNTPGDVTEALLTLALQKAQAQDDAKANAGGPAAAQ